jgi:hypothetical protein
MADLQIFPLGDVVLQSGATLWQARLAYTTYGTLTPARDNVVLIPTFYAGQHTDVELMIAAGRAIDPAKLVVVPNMLGNGHPRANTPLPFDRAAFPRVTIHDNVICQHRLVTEHPASRRSRPSPSMGAAGVSVGLHWIWWRRSRRSAATRAPHPTTCSEVLKAVPTPRFNDEVREAAGGLIASRACMPAHSQDSIAHHEFRKMGLSSIEDVCGSGARYRSRRQRSARDVVTRQHADISANPRSG